MHNIIFKDKTFQCRLDETVLEALLRHGVELSFSCRKGSCQVCMLECESGVVGAEAVEGLRPVFKKNGYFLPCMCKPQSDVVINEIEHTKLFSAAYIIKKELLSETVCRLFIETDKITEYEPGQFINISRPEDGETRSYSIASLPDKDPYIEIHVQRMNGGLLSNWIFDELKEMDEIEIQGPVGTCTYRHISPQIPILMVATGTGMAPVIGVLREAIYRNHSGPVHVYHEGKSESDHYMGSELTELSEKYENISYYPCLATEKIAVTETANSAVNTIQENHRDLSEWCVYLAGSGQMVTALHDIAIARGAVEENIFSDAFDLKDLRESDVLENNSLNRRKTDANTTPAKDFHEVAYPQADVEIWQALEEGKKLNAILNDFYTIVYNDARLSPFFMNITKQRSIEKVYLFLRQIFTGEKVYLGDRPRNAHHWMVISDELFDYREDIMMDCLRKHDIPEHLIKRWRAIEETFRPDIVKSKPWNKVINGVEMPLDGFEELVLDSGTLCDSCQQAIDVGTHVRYHVRLGTVYCPECISETEITHK